MKKENIEIGLNDTLVSVSEMVVLTGLQKQTFSSMKKNFENKKNTLYKFWDNKIILKVSELENLRENYFEKILEKKIIEVQNDNEKIKELFTKLIKKEFNLFLDDGKRKLQLLSPTIKKIAEENSKYLLKNMSPLFDNKYKEIENLLEEKITEIESKFVLLSNDDFVERLVEQNNELLNQNKKLFEIIEEQNQQIILLTKKKSFFK